MGVTNAGDGSGRLFVLEQPGRVRVVRGGRVGSSAYLDVSSLVSYGGERGLVLANFRSSQAEARLLRGKELAILP